MAGGQALSALEDTRMIILEFLLALGLVVLIDVGLLEYASVRTRGMFGVKELDDAKFRGLYRKGRPFRIVPLTLSASALFAARIWPSNKTAFIVVAVVLTAIYFTCFLRDLYRASKRSEIR